MPEDRTPREPVPIAAEPPARTDTSTMLLGSAGGGVIGLFVGLAAAAVVFSIAPYPDMSAVWSAILIFGVMVWLGGSLGCYVALRRWHFRAAGLTALGCASLWLALGCLVLLSSVLLGSFRLGFALLAIAPVVPLGVGLLLRQLADGAGE